MHHGTVVAAAGRGGPEQRGLVRGEVGGEADAGAGGQTAEVAGGDCVQEQFSSAEGGKVSKEKGKDKEQERSTSYQTQF